MIGAEPWFDPKIAIWAGSIGGALFGLWGGIFGSMCSYFIPRGKGRGFLVSSMVVQTLIGLASLVSGIIAVIAGQPYSIWYSFTLVGFLMSVFGIGGYFILQKRYSDWENMKKII